MKILSSYIPRWSKKGTKNDLDITQDKIKHNVSAPAVLQSDQDHYTPHVHSDNYDESYITMDKVGEFHEHGDTNVRFHSTPYEDSDKNHHTPHTGTRAQAHLCDMKNDHRNVRVAVSSSPPRLQHIGYPKGNLGSPTQYNHNVINDRQNNVECDYDSNELKQERYTYQPATFRHHGDFDGPTRIREESRYTEKSKRRQKEPDKFDGQKIEWTDYLRHYETVSDWNHWSYSEKGMQLAMALQGEARRVLGDLPQQYGNIDYNMLVTELNYRYNPAEREFTFRMEFKGRNKKSDETIMQYGYALRRLAVKAFPSISTNCLEQLILDQFVTGLINTDIKRHVQFGHPRNLNEAIALATEFESFDQRIVVKPSKPYGNVMAVDSSGQSSIENATIKELCDTLKEAKNEIHTLKGHLNTYINGKAENSSLPKVVSNDKNRRVRCYRCSEEGHYQRDCPKQPHTNRPPTHHLN